MRLCIPYDKTALVERLRREANLLDLRYGETGVEAVAVVRPALGDVLRPYEEQGDG